MNTIEFNADGGQDADVWVDDTTVMYGDKKAILGGDTYEILSSNGDDLAGELEWNAHHCTFDGGLGEWVIDHDSLDVLADLLSENGYVLDDGQNDTETDEELFHLARRVEGGDDIEVEYEQKNGEGLNTKTGEVTQVIDDDDPFVLFCRDDGQTMRIKTDEHGDVGLFTGGYHPFVGTVTEVRVEERWENLPDNIVKTDPMASTS